METLSKKEIEKSIQEANWNVEYYKDQIEQYKIKLRVAEATLRVLTKERINAI